MAMIKDSGERTEFESGAVRDMHKGKGRFDIMKMDVKNTVKETGKRESRLIVSQTPHLDTLRNIWTA